jgi:hypothetical protein
VPRVLLAQVADFYHRTIYDGVLLYDDGRTVIRRRHQLDL